MGVLRRKVGTLGIARLRPTPGRQAKGEGRTYRHQVEQRRRDRSVMTSDGGCRADGRPRETAIGGSYGPALENGRTGAMTAVEWEGKGERRYKMRAPYLAWFFVVSDSRPRK